MFIDAFYFHILVFNILMKQSFSEEHQILHTVHTCNGNIMIFTSSTQKSQGSFTESGSQI